MVKYSIVVTLLLVVRAGAFNPNGLWEPPQTGASGSAAVADDALGVPVNPAGLAAGHGLNVYFARHVQSGLGVRNWHLYADTLLGGFGYAQAHDVTMGVRASRFTWTLAYPLRGWFGVGAGLNRLAASKPYYTSAWTIDAGLLLRPSRYLSLGLVAKDLNEPRFLRLTRGRSYVLGVGVRPGFDRITLSADGHWTEDDTDLSDLGWRFGLDVEPVDGLVVRAAYDDEEVISAGVSFGFTYGSAGYNAAFDADGDYVRDSAFVSANFERKRSFLSFGRDYAVFEIGGELTEEGKPWSIFGGPAVNVRELLRNMENAREDPDIKGVVLRVDEVDPGFGTGLSALAQEIRNEIEKIRRDGKPVYCYLERATVPATYYIASACDYIMLPEAGVIAALGTEMDMWRVTGFTERYGVEWDYITAGAYKGSFHIVGDDPTEKDYEQVEALVDDTYGVFTRDCSDGRGLSETRFREVVEGEILVGRRALDAGFVDGVGTYEDLTAYIAHKDGKDGERISPVDIEGRRYWAGTWGEPKCVRVIIATGSIVSGESGHSILTGSRRMGSETVVRQLESARKDPRVGAVVLRVDSGGGGAVPSQAIAEEMSRFRESGKTVVVSMGDLAASGGYFISAPAGRIFASEVTLTGSIGVVFAKPSLEGLYEKYGFERYPVKAHEHTDARTYHRHLTDEETEWLEKSIGYIYDVFVNEVSESRGMDKEELLNLAGGRVYTGSRAKEVGLVDELGGLDEAVFYAKAAAGLPEDAPVEYVGYHSSFWRELLGGVSSGLSVGEILTR